MAFTCSCCFNLVFATKSSRGGFGFDFFSRLLLWALLFFYLVFFPVFGFFFHLFCCQQNELKKFIRVNGIKIYRYWMLRHWIVCAAVKNGVQCVLTVYIERSIFENGHFWLKGCTIVFVCKCICVALLPDTNAIFLSLADWTSYTQLRMSTHTKKREENTCKSHQYFMSDSLGCRCCSDAGASFDCRFFSLLLRTINGTHFVNTFTSS